jgi:diguanylate cyclase (GGDEF)-like protein/PAS domain S-box-containing protein
MSGHVRPAGSAHYLLAVLLAAVGYAGAATVGFHLASIYTTVSAVWAPSGIALALLLLGGRRFWPAILLGAFVAYALTNASLPTAAALALGNTSGALVASALCRRAQLSLSLSRPHDIVALLLASPAGAAVSVSIGTITLWSAGYLPAHDLAGAAGVWFLSDLTGLFVVTPLVLVIANRRVWLLGPSDLLGRLSRTDLLAGAAITLTFVAALLLCLWDRLAMPYLLLVPVVWAAVRFRISGATAAITATAATLVAVTVADSGPFVSQGVAQDFDLLNGFLCSVAMVALLLAALANERASLAEGLRKANLDLVSYSGQLGEANSEISRGAEAAGSSQEKARLSEERFRRTFDNAPVGVALMDVEGNYLQANRSLCALLGRDEESLAALTTEDVRHPDDVEQSRYERMALLAGHLEVSRHECRFLRPDGVVVWAVETTTAERSAYGEVTGLLTQVVDITERKRAESALEHLAFHDSLRHLPNRLLVQDRIDQALRAANRQGKQVAVLLANVDHFESVNDKHGRGVGDELLAQVADRLRRTARTNDTVAHFGGDEFVVICEAIADIDVALGLAERIHDAFAEPFVVAGNHFTMSASVGVAIHSRPDSVKELLRKADAAMYSTKTRGGGRTALYDGADGLREHRRPTTEDLLRRAIDSDALMLFYQPVVALDSGRVIGAEALLRWEHPEHGLVLPSQFLNVAEQSGLMPMIGQWVLQTVVRQAAQWSCGRPDGLLGWVSANLSASELANPDLPEVAAACLRETGLDPNALVLEVAEASFRGDPPNTISNLRRFGATGLRIAIDDFGSGSSSIDGLTTLPIKLLKLDRSFVSDLPRSPVTADAAATIVAVGHQIGLTVLAQGAETESDVRALQSVGCDLVQGFYVSHPIPSASLPRFVLDETRRYPQATP